MVDISVIIPVYNAGPLIKRCLDSVLAQKGDYTYEVLLIDDGSTDDSVEIIKSYNNTKFKIFQQKNTGPAAARNVGITNAQGKYIAFLDADDYWEDEYIEETTNFLEENRDCIAVTVGQKYLDNGHFLKVHPKFMQNNNVNFEYYELINIQRGFIINDFYEFWTKWKHVGTCSTTMRRSVLLESGGQRGGLRICEDLEFWPYLASWGKWGFIPKILYISDGGAIVREQGWDKYVMRFKNVPMFDVWFSRLKHRLSNEQIDKIKPMLNDVICGESRAMISGGDYKRSYENLKFFYNNYPKPYPVKIMKVGRLVYYSYAILWRFYQYLKINRGVIFKKMHIR